MKNFQTEGTSTKIKKAKEEIMKELKESIMGDKNVNKDVEESAENIEKSDNTAEFAKEMEKPIKSNKCIILWFAYQQGKYLKEIKLTINL